MQPSERDHNEPEPDLAVVLEDKDEYEWRHPACDETILVIEVADVATLGLDTVVKRWLYARAGVPEYWVLDVVGRRLIVHQRPIAGDFADVRVYSEDQIVSFGGSEMAVRQFIS